MIAAAGTHFSRYERPTSPMAVAHCRNQCTQARGEAQRTH